MTEVSKNVHHIFIAASLVLLLGIAILLTPTAHAEESTGAVVETETSAGGDVTPQNPTAPMPVPPPKPPRPIKEINANLEVRKERVQDRIASTSRAMDARKEALKEKIASTSAARKENMTERRDALKDKVQELRGDIKARIASEAKMQIETTARKMKQRLEAAVKRLENISTRIDSRIDKLTEEGLDMSTAISLKATADLKIAAAKTAVGALVKPTPTDDTREAHKAAFEALRAQVKAAEEAVKEAHRALMAVIPEIKGKGRGEGETDASAESSSN